MCKGIYPMATKQILIQCSDGAGTIVGVGRDAGDDVCSLFFRDFDECLFTAAKRPSSLGALNNGVLRRYAVFNETSLIMVPVSLTLEEASTLSSAALTAWKALFGLEGRKLRGGQSVLTQGTGGVSLFAIQFALAVGADVIAATSSEDKAQRLRDMGVKHVLSYRTQETGEHWGKT
ncbi:hypothetical protein LTR47_006971 [Exophiala xenobiotica]|nr:hypothetical protein LTR47_006971 [Exophiala xenobiotica]KAK5283235.1 hypothetical protein LTR40_002073 [Exophiala xenobiotica]KAK5353654.1 hypothetical protein LTR61_002348 [Exophiala xenobiotica]KAK5370463.1 hypothetical protein LTR11_006674 [Exophiala xenobiotica]